MDSRILFSNLVFSSADSGLDRARVKPVQKPPSQRRYSGQQFEAEKIAIFNLKCKNQKVIGTEVSTMGRHRMLSFLPGTTEPSFAGVAQ